MKRLHHDYWVERLLQLRHEHTREQVAQARQDINSRCALTRQYQQEKPFFQSPFERAMLIQRQMDRIIEFEKEKQNRRETLRKRQSVEVYNLLLLKSEATDSRVASAPYHDR